jgi:hypothetical protein
MASPLLLSSRSRRHGSARSGHRCGGARQDIDARAARAQDVEPRDGAIIEVVDLSGLSRDSLSPVCGANSTR